MEDEFENILGIKIDQKAYKAFIESFGIKFGEISIEIIMTSRKIKSLISLSIETTQIGLIGNPSEINITSFGQEIE